MACKLVVELDNGEKIKSFVNHVPILLHENVEYFNINCLQMAMYSKSKKFDPY
jgi:hypothetical protein